MMIRFQCPSCRAQYQTDENKLAHVNKVTCKKCQSAFEWKEAAVYLTTQAASKKSGEAQAEFTEQQNVSNWLLKERYRIERMIGEGGLATTYQALDLQTERPVAVKVLHLVRMKEWKNLEMFEREAKILQQINHPQIPAYIDYFSVETGSDIQFILVQEYIEGHTLQEIVEKGSQASESTAIKLIRQVANILNYLHALRPPVIHRDINPKNILLGTDKKVYLVDFGAVQEKIRTTGFRESSIVGTCGYAPFEQFNGKAVPASDYYALGGTLLFLLTRKHPSEFPLRNLKPLFHETFQASPVVVQLLDGLLEPDVRKRIASPNEITAIYEPSAVVKKQRTPLRVEQQITKPPQTDIEKEIKSAGHILFRIPMTDARKKQTDLASKDLFQMFKKKKDDKEMVLEFTPQWINFNNVWNVATDSLRTTDITWHIENNVPVLGINTHDGETFYIQANLNVAEVMWLVQELLMHLSTLPGEQRALHDVPKETVPVRRGFFAKLFPPMHLALKRDEHDKTVRFTIPTESELAGCLTMGIALPVMFLTMALPPKIFGPKLGMALLPFLWLFVIGPLLLRLHFLISARTMILEMTPEHIFIKHRLLKWDQQKFPPIPLSALQESDVNWFDQFVNVNKGKRLKLSFGINYRGATYTIDDPKLDSHALECLVQDVRDYIARHSHQTGEEKYV